MVADPIPSVAPLAPPLESLLSSRCHRTVLGTDMKGPFPSCPSCLDHEPATWRSGGPFRSHRHIEGVGTRECAQHPTRPRTAPTTKNDPDEMQMVPQRGNCSRGSTAELLGESWGPPALGFLIMGRNTNKQTNKQRPSP